MTRLRADLLLLITALIWGAAFVGQSTAMEHIGPLTFTGLRFCLAALAVAPFALAEARTQGAFPRHKLGALALIGGTFFLASTGQQIGLLATSVTNAGFLTALYVVMVPAIGFAILRKPVHPVVWPAAMLSLGGTYLLGGGSLAGLTWGDWVMIVSAAFWAVQILLMGSLAHAVRQPVTVAAGQFAITGALALSLGLIFEAPAWGAILEAWPQLAFTGIISGGLGFTLQAISQRHTPASDAAIIMSSEALFAALFGALLLGERLPLVGWLGCTFILIAVLMTQLAPQRNSAKP